MIRGEFELIARHFAPLARGGGALGLTDDAAILTAPPGRDLVVSTDAIVEGVHFLPGEAADVLAHRLLAVGFSDVAAMAAAPLAYTLVVALPRSWQNDAVDAWLARFAAGLQAGAAALAVELLGGDTVATPGPLSLSLTVFGSIAPGTALTRGGARPGDLVGVSGTIGDAALGLAVLQGHVTGLQSGVGDFLVERFRRPAARCRLGQALNGVATAAADVSDGLIADLGHICRASGLTAVIERDAVPLSAAARTVLDAGLTGWPALLSGGDDYELVVAVPPERRQVIAAASARAGTPLRIIGHFAATACPPDCVPVQVIGPGGQRLDVGEGGYRHF